MNDHDVLVRDLTRLARDLPPAQPPAGLAATVLERIATQPTPLPRAQAPWSRFWSTSGSRAASWLQPWPRRVAIAVLALLVGLLATPPVRAAVSDWFGFGGVVVERGPAATEDAPPPPEVEDAMTVDEAAELVGFTPVLPEALGEPDAVDVSADRVIVSMTWSTDDGPVRLDQFDGRLDYRIAKTSPGVRYAAVAGVDALWFDRPHEVVLLGAGGEPRRESARLAGNTLIWPVGDLTMRLEGDLGLTEAVEVASSAVPYDGR